MNVSSINLKIPLLPKKKQLESFSKTPFKLFMSNEPKTKQFPAQNNHRQKIQSLIPINNRKAVRIYENYLLWQPFLASSRRY
jgi:hypothetical protein